MKSTHVIFLSAFVTFMICGFWVGSYLTDGEYLSLSGRSHLPSIEPIPTMKEGQYKILIITADQLSQTHPKLISIWLMTYYSANPTVAFQPVYPSITDAKLITDEKLVASFQIISINSQPHLSGSFLSALSERNIQWSGYFIIDRQILSKILTDSIPYGFTHTNISNQQSYSQLIEDNNALEVYQQERHALQVICHKLEDKQFDLDWTMLRDSAPHYVNTDLDAALIFDTWEASLSMDKSPICVLPVEFFSPVEELE